MKTFVTLAFVALLSPVQVTAQSAPVPVGQAREKKSPAPSIGVLIGLDRLYDSEIPPSAEEIQLSLDEKKSVEYQRQRGGPEDSEGAKPLRYDTAPEESPYATVWLQWTPVGSQVRLLRDIILPRKDGFWRFGTNHSSIEVGGDDDEDFFWLARLGSEPTLTRAEWASGGGSQESTRRLTYICPDYFSYRELLQGWGGTYGESEYASVRSLDEFGKVPPKEADYDYDHPGLSLVAVLGPGAELEFKKITKQGVPEDSKDAQSDVSPERENEDPCAGSGYRTSETDWHLSHRQDRWVALLGLQNGGPGICDRQTDWTPLATRLPSSLVGHARVPVPWRLVEKAFPGARHVFYSPKGDWLVVLTRNQVYLAPVRGASVGKPLSSAKIPYGIPVMAQWSIGKYVSVWDQQLSKLPSPNDQVIFTLPGLLNNEPVN